MFLIGLHIVLHIGCVRAHYAIPTVFTMLLLLLEVFATLSAKLTTGHFEVCSK